VRKLLQGIVEYRERMLPRYAEKFRDLANRQCPDTLFITCSDSRVVPDLLASTDPGDLFVVRNVGNLISPSTADGVSTGDLSEASAIEYAVLVLQVADVVVCGHSSCGAMAAVLAAKGVEGAANLGKWLHHASTARFRLDNEGPLCASLPPGDQLSQLNVLVQLEHLMTYPVVRERVAAGKLHLSGLWFDIGKGEVSVYERDCRCFVPIDRAEAERLSQRLWGGRAG
jgi:carbonic anhydrase